MPKKKKCSHCPGYIWCPHYNPADETCNEKEVNPVVVRRDKNGNHKI